MEAIKLIKSFKQGGAGNCVSIAVIKASIQVFGLHNVVHFQTLTPDSISFIMKDGFEGVLGQDEMAIAEAGSRFQCLENRAIFDYSNKCFAAMAKRLLDEGYGNATTFTMAVSELNDGEHYHKGADFLGLRHYRRAVGLKYVLSNIGVVGASKKHCFFCSNGLVDNYGVPDRINILERIKYRFFDYYRIDSKPAY